MCEIAAEVIEIVAVNDACLRNNKRTQHKGSGAAFPLRYNTLLSPEVPLSAHFEREVGVANLGTWKRRQKGSLWFKRKVRKIPEFETTSTFYNQTKIHSKRCHMPAVAAVTQLARDTQEIFGSVLLEG